MFSNRTDMVVMPMMVLKEVKTGKGPITSSDKQNEKNAELRHGLATSDSFL